MSIIASDRVYGDAVPAEPLLTSKPGERRLPAVTAPAAKITQICQGTNQIHRMIMARQLLK